MSEKGDGRKEAGKEGSKKKKEKQRRIVVGSEIEEEEEEKHGEWAGFDQVAPTSAASCCRPML